MGLIKMLDNDNKIVRLTSSILNMDIILNTSTDNIVVFHHNDADGKLSAQLVYETLKLKNILKGLYPAIMIMPNQRKVWLENRILYLL